MTDMNDNQNTKAELLQQLTETHRQAPTISRFVEEYFSELVPHSDYFAHLVRDDVGGEMLPPLPEEVIARLPRYYTAVTDLYDAPFLKTSQATALFALTSAMMPNSYVRHGKRLVSPAVMVIHYGTSSAARGWRHWPSLPSRSMMTTSTPCSSSPTGACSRPCTSIADWCATMTRSLSPLPRSPRRCSRASPRSSPEPMRCVSVANLEFPRAPSNDTSPSGRKPM